jgi:hypothetical protein
VHQQLPEVKLDRVETKEGKKIDEASDESEELDLAVSPLQKNFSNSSSVNTATLA